jgi:hypothetical protein
MWNALAAMEAWLAMRESPVDGPALLDMPFCHAGDFLFQWLALPPKKRRLVASILTGYEDGDLPDGDDILPVESCQ